MEHKQPTNLTLMPTSRKEMKDFIDGAEDGLIVFSLGSFLSVTSIPRAIQEGISAAFKKLPSYRFANSIVMGAMYCTYDICSAVEEGRRSPNSGCSKVISGPNIKVHVSAHLPNSRFRVVAKLPSDVCSDLVMPENVMCRDAIPQFALLASPETRCSSQQLGFQKRTYRTAPVPLGSL